MTRERSQFNIQVIKYKIITYPYTGRVNHILMILQPKPTNKILIVGNLASKETNPLYYSTATSEKIHKSISNGSAMTIAMWHSTRGGSL